MLLFRSEEHVAQWCAERTLPRGALLTVAQGWRLARDWYADRLDPNYRGKTPTEMKATLTRIGLTGPYWQA